jgi:acetyl-CoA/propionyl-CoA carboxylase, biotin carboxylase, biotin carboxyl carrier protein
VSAVTVRDVEHQSFDAVLVANRGEIAVRVIRTVQQMGLRAVAVYSEADRDAPHVAAADSAVLLGPAPATQSYLRIDRVIEAARREGAGAIHPGYGFLSENPRFAEACAAAGLVFIGPPVRAIEVMGDKVAAKQAMVEAGVPIVPGVALSDDDGSHAELAAQVGYPLLVKPSAGGGGKGMHRVDSAEDLASAVQTARREAASSFGDDRLLIERYIERPRHIEVQVLADQYGSVVHLGERECSLQRRHQKVVEEAPSPLLDAETRERIGGAACTAAASIGYLGVGTVEFLVAAARPDEFFFIEMNTRLQVEHPVTEQVTGLDLVEWQVRTARGERLGMVQDDIALSGHAIEARVYAEDPGHGFLPTGGRVLMVREPDDQPGVRVDSGLAAGTTVGSAYDPMLAKVIASGPDRHAALLRLDRALASTAVLGVGTNVHFLRALLAEPAVVAGDLDTHLLDDFAESYRAPSVPDDVLIAAAAARQWSGIDPTADPWEGRTGWRLSGSASVRHRFLDPIDPAIVHEVTLTGDPADAVATVDTGSPTPMRCELSADGVRLEVDGRTASLSVASGDDGVQWLAVDGGCWRIVQAPPPVTADATAHAGDVDLLSPMPGTVVAAPVASGELVEAGTGVVVVEAMKMEHTLSAPVAGRVELLVRVGDQVALQQPLARVVHLDGEPGARGNEQVSERTEAPA